MECVAEMANYYKSDAADVTRSILQVYVCMYVRQLNIHMYSGSMIMFQQHICYFYNKNKVESSQQLFSKSDYTHNTYSLVVGRFNPEILESKFLHPEILSRENPGK